jgi:hypothetical protein
VIIDGVVAIDNDATPAGGTVRYFSKVVQMEKASGTNQIKNIFC